MSKIKKEKSELIRMERLTWFSPAPQNEVLEKNGHIYFKHWDGNKNRWTVSEFTKQSWRNMHGTSYKKNKTDYHEMEQAHKELEEKYFID